ncbi:putative initiation-control protein [Kosakonia phage Kc263]|uniref:Initiation-control protein n=1 Tax=Kosakonia phage Kc263 TaxID=2863194 RepID=A0AAE8BEG1_9CAUD|nr:putative initiation-control protein [Kosakonia phage Kc263]QYN79970.1 putative initiation-control protein [Kosakonia phage Kc263]
MGTVSGDCWTHARNTPIVEGIEYFNYSNYDVVITDRLGIEMEILRCTERPERLEDRGKVVVRITRAVDPRRVQVPSLEAQLECDREYLITFARRIEELKGRIGLYEPETNQVRMYTQIEMRFDFLTPQATARSNLLGITIRETSNLVEKSHGDNPIGYIESVMVKELEEIDQEDDKGEDKGIRTLFSARLIDNQSRVGVLWTSAFGGISRILPVKDEEQEDGLYLAGGLRLQHKQFIPIADLQDPKKLLSYNLHVTEREARKHSTGEFTASVMTEKDKLKKENRELHTENKKLTGKVDDLENKMRVEKINRAQSDFKQTVQMEKLKEYRADDYVGGINRFLITLVANLKVVLNVMQLLKY